MRDPRRHEPIALGSTWAGRGCGAGWGELLVGGMRVHDRRPEPVDPMGTTDTRLGVGFALTAGMAVQL